MRFNNTFKLEEMQTDERQADSLTTEVELKLMFGK